MEEEKFKNKEESYEHCCTNKNICSIECSPKEDSELNISGGNC